MRQASAVLGVMAATIWMALADRPASGQNPLTTAESASKADAETPEGKKFGQTLGRAFGREYGTIIQRCARETKRPDLSDFDLFLRVDGEGIVDRALVKPATNLAACVQSRVTGWKSPAPPHPGFWVKVAVNLKRKQPVSQVRAIGAGDGRPARWISVAGPQESIGSPGTRHTF